MRRENRGEREEEKTEKGEKEEKEEEVEAILEEIEKLEEVEEKIGPSLKIKPPILPEEIREEAEEYKEVPYKIVFTGSFMCPFCKMENKVEFGPDKVPKSSQAYCEHLIIVAEGSIRKHGVDGGLIEPLGGGVIMCRECGKTYLILGASRFRSGEIVGLEFVRRWKGRIKSV